MISAINTRLCNSQCQHSQYWWEEPQMTVLGGVSSSALPPWQMIDSFGVDSVFACSKAADHVCSPHHNHHLQNINDSTEQKILVSQIYYNLHCIKE